MDRANQLKNVNDDFERLHEIGHEFKRIHESFACKAIFDSLKNLNPFAKILSEIRKTHDDFTQRLIKSAGFDQIALDINKTLEQNRIALQSTINITRNSCFSEITKVFNNNVLDYKSFTKNLEISKSYVNFLKQIDTGYIDEINKTLKNTYTSMFEKLSIKELIIDNNWLGNIINDDWLKEFPNFEITKNHNEKNENINTQFIISHLENQSNDIKKQLLDFKQEMITIAKNNKDSKIQQIVIGLLISFIFTLSTYLYNKIYEYANFNTKPKFKKMSDKAIKNNVFGIKMPERYGFVKTNNLKVKTQKKLNSQTINVLQIGDLVKIITKNKKWTFIGFYDELYNLYYQGWVLTRYINKFKSKK